MIVGVVGGGVVGRATARAFLEHVDEVRVYDVVKERRTHALYDVMEDSDIVFVCLPTPQKAGSLECDTSVLDDFLRGFAGTSKNLVIRSTVPVGFTRDRHLNYRLPNLVHSPEFLTARCATVDAMTPTRNLIGVPNLTHRATDGHPCVPGSLTGATALESLYRERFPHVKIHYLSSDESEAVKLFTNAFFATKVAFWNEMRAFAESKKLDWNAVMAAVLADGRIHPSHTQVPGPDGEYGFGGACLPKDAASLIYQMQQSGSVPFVTLAAHNRNALIDRRES